MGANSKIGWTHHTANLWWGCTEVHAGCDHCYARGDAMRYGKTTAWKGDRLAIKGVWKNLRAWQDAAAEAGEVHRVFTGSMMDIFEKSLPASDWQAKPLDATTGDLRDRFFREVVPATPNLLHLLLTKRPGNIIKSVPPAWLEDWPENVMTGTSVVDQATADTLIPQLLRAPGRHFLSVEPLLAPVDLGRWLDGPESGVDWAIVGAESRGGNRPMDEDWVRAIRDQCVRAGVLFFYKQRMEGHRRVELPELDGRTWDQTPEIAYLETTHA